MQHWELLFFFLSIAFVYASVGFGGGSSYLAVLSLYSFLFRMPDGMINIHEMRLIALICNIIVVTGGTIIFIRNKQVAWKKVLPLIVVSVPASFGGALVRLDQDTFFVLLGCSLVVAAVLLWIKTKRAGDEAEVTYKSNMIKEGLLGGAIGFLSGMVGIGGGIFLSPVLNLMKWDAPKKIAATASLFILVNSISGIAGQMTDETEYINYVRVGFLCGAVLIGGLLGSLVGAAKFNQLVIRRVTAVLVFAAGMEVLVKHIKSLME
jgi:uncharacterized protein